MPKEGGHGHSGGGGPGPTATNPNPTAWETLTFALQTLFAVKPMDPNGFSAFRMLQDSICKDCTVLAGKMDVIFANGTRAGLSKGVYLHHAITIDLTKPTEGFMSMCGGNKTTGPISGGRGVFVGGAVVSCTVI
jgi:hypothetical protein